MVILVDTNIILDVIASREPFVTESRKILELCARQEISTTRLTGGLLYGYKPLLPASV